MDILHEQNPSAADAIAKVGYSHDKDFSLAHTLFTYEPLKGELWRKVGSGAARAGELAGSDNGFGYVRINFNGKLRLRSHLVWLMLMGRWPVQDLDHINRQKGDDRIENLREVSRQLNLQNKQKANRNSGTGIRGVAKRGDYFTATITHNRQQRFLGNYSSVEAARTAYERARQKLHAGYTGENV